MKIKKIIILVFVILVVGAAIILFWPKDNVNEPVLVAVRDAADRTYVRLSLFNTMPNKISLEIPEDWEGSYRVKDSGNLARIFFIEEADEWELISFKQFSQSEWRNNKDKNWQLISEDNKLIIAYKLSTGKDLGLDQMPTYNNMLVDIPALLKSIKIR